MAEKPTDKSMTAAQKVFTLPELVTNIFAHLPKEKLFTVQRVNSTFQRTITETKALQDTMYRETLQDSSERHKGLSWYNRDACNCCTFSSSVLRRAMEPILLRHLSISDGKVFITCEYLFRPYFARDTSHDSWRQIRLDYGELPIQVRETGWYESVSEFGPRPTLGEVYDRRLETRSEIIRGMRLCEGAERYNEYYGVGESREDDEDGHDDGYEFEEYEEIEYSYRG